MADTKEREDRDAAIRQRWYAGAGSCPQELDTPYRHEEFARRSAVDIDGVTMWLVSAEDLLLSKLVWAAESRSEIQLQDVRNLIRSVADLDWTYIEHWGSELMVGELLREVRG